MSPSIRDFFKNAFSVQVEGDTLSKEDEELLAKLAEGIVSRRLTAPAIAFLESVKPLNFLGSQAMLFFRPIVGAIFPTRVYDQIEKILEKRSGIEHLLSAIERVEGVKNEKRD